MTEPVRVDAPRLLLNASVFGTKKAVDNGRIRVRLVVDTEVPVGFEMATASGATIRPTMKSHGDRSVPT